LPQTSAWSPLRHRDFAVLWSAALVSNIGSWMHDAAAGWLMTTLSAAPSMVVLVQAATAAPVFLLALPAGTLADRVDKRWLQIITQTVMLVLAALLGMVVLTGSATPTLLLVFTFAMGCCTAVLSPAWQSIMPQLVPRPELQSAIALHAVGMNISRAIGPALGGLIIVAAGLAWPFFINAASFVAVIAALLWWRAPQAAPAPASTESRPGFMAALLQGLALPRSHRALQNTLWRSVMFYVFGSCYWALLPLVARVQLQGTAKLFGVLVGCIGAGAVLGAMLLPRLRQRLGLDGVVVAGTLGTAAALTGYALLRIPALGMVASLLAGASWIASLSSLNVAAQLAVPDWARGRGMALYTAVFYGCLAVGSIAWGQVAEHIGLTATLLIAAAGAVLCLMPARLLPLKAAASG
jgi:MFS family permease